MSTFDFDAHKNLSNSPMNTVQAAIDMANKKSSLGVFRVCKTIAGEILVLPEFAASVRKDISEVVYDTALGYSFSANQE